MYVGQKVKFSIGKKELIGTVDYVQYQSIMSLPGGEVSEPHFSIVPDGKSLNYLFEMNQAKKMQWF